MSMYIDVHTNSLDLTDLDSCDSNGLGWGGLPDNDKDDPPATGVWTNHCSRLIYSFFYYVDSIMFVVGASMAILIFDLCYFCHHMMWCFQLWTFRLVDR